MKLAIAGMLLVISAGSALKLNDQPGNVDRSR